MHNSVVWAAKFTEMVEAIQADALEAAAKECDRDDAGGKAGGFDLLRSRLARRIRGLIPKKENRDA